MFCQLQNTPILIYKCYSLSEFRIFNIIIAARIIAIPINPETVGISEKNIIPDKVDVIGSEEAIIEAFPAGM